MAEKEQEQNTELQKGQEQPEQNATENSAETLIKNFEEKIAKMQEENNKKLAEKDDLIKQLIMNKGSEKKLTDDEQSIEKITNLINKRR